MPADAVAGLFEAVVGLVMALIEGLLLLIELVVEAIFVLVELVLWLLGKRRHLDRPGWISRRRRSPASRIKSLVISVLFVSALGYFAFQFFGYTRLSFDQKGFSRPHGVEVVLIRDETAQVAVIEEGKLKVRRDCWDRLVVRDPRYQPADFAITGRRMNLRLEKIPTTRDVATEAVVDKAADLLWKKFGPSDEAKDAE